MKDGGRGAFMGAGFAIDTLLRVNEQHRFAFVETVTRANDNAICVLAVKTGFSNNVCHGRLLNQELKLDLESGSNRLMQTAAW
jgi:hypothetical protein